MQHFEQYVTDHKREFIARVLDQRTRHVTVVLEDIYQSQNASAVVRTCECFGIQDIHIVENKSKYQVNPRVLKGSHKWVTLVRHRGREQDNTVSCFDKLKRDGYTILVAEPDAAALPVHDIDVTKKTAVVFGNELRGLSDTALQLADQKITIPMVGFTESLNISVSVAITLTTLFAAIRRHNTGHFISSDEKDKLRLDWYRKIVRRSDLIEREFLKTIQ